MERRKILVLNSALHPAMPKICYSQKGENLIHLVEIWRPEHLERIQGQVYDDVVWVRPLQWNDPYRQVIEDSVNSRLVNRG